MTQTPISLLLLKRLTLSSQLPKPPIFPLLSSLKPYHSTSTSTATASSSSPDPPKPTSLSSRLSFVFDQIDAIERDRVQKDQTLQRIRTWRHARNQEPTVLAGTENQNPGEKSTQDVKFEPRLNEERESEFGLAETTSSGEVRREKKEVELVHPWPEWIELMGRLLQQNYFDHRRKDENKIFENLGLDDVGNGDGGVDEVDDFGIDFKDFRTVQTACLNLGKDRFDIMRSLSRQDIQLLVGYGCPSADKKVVFSAKLLRKHAHLDEGDICSSCSLRSSCERAYLLTNKEDEARTIDIMRILLAYGFDPINDSALNKTLLKKKSVKTVVRKLLHEVVKLSAVPIDPNLPPPVIKKAPPKVKQPPPPPKRRVGRDDVEMKKGDWLCPKCDFMNFAKNSVCLQCDAKRPKRQLLPGEWECPECNFLNYRRNMACFHCECKRPPDEFMENKMEGRQREHHTRPEKVSSRSEVSNAWNFDFDDNESDGADVAAFEYADSVRGEDSPLDSRVPGGNFMGPEGDLERGSRISRVHDGEYSDPDQGRYGRGFDDFDEEDDVDSYELDTQNSIPEWKASRNNFSDNGISGLKEVGGSDDELYTSHRRGPLSYSKPMRQKAALPGSEDYELDSDSDEELSVHPKWKSSHVADARNKPRGRGAKDSSKRMSFGSDEEADLDSDLDDDFGSTRKQRGSGRMNVRRNPDLEDVSFSGSDSDNDNQRNKGNKNFRGRGSHNFVREAKVGSKGKMGDSRDSWRDDFEGSFSSSHGKGRGFQGNGRGGRRMNDRGRNNSWSDDDDGSFARSHGKSRGFQGNERGGRRMNDRGKNNSWSDDDDEGSFARSHGKSRGFQGNEHGGRRMNDRGKNNSWSDDDEGSFARSHGKSRGFQDNGRGGRRMNDRSRNNSWSDDDGDSFPRSHGKGRGFRDNDRGGRRANDRGGDIRSSRGTKRGGFEKRQGGRSDGYTNDRDWDDSEFRNSRRVIER